MAKYSRNVKASTANRVSLDHMNRGAVAERVQLLRRVLAPSQTALCKALRINSASWSQYENATESKRDITLRVALKLSVHYGVSLDYIFRGIESSLPGDIREQLRERRRHSSAE